MRAPQRRTKAQILVLEDDPLDAELILDELSHANIAHETRRVDRREAFIDAIHGNTCFDLVLLDYQLPAFDALDALDLLRARDPHVPAVVVSGKVGEEVAIEALKRGATDYVLKQRLSRLGPVVTRALHERDLDLRRREAEARLGEVAAELEHTALIQMVFEQLQSAVMVAEVPSGRILFANARAQAMLGSDLDAMVASSEYGRMLLLHDEGHRYTAAEFPLARAVERGEVVRDEHVRFLEPGNRIGHAIASATQIHDRQGRARVAICVLTEITERLSLLADLDRESEHLESVLRAATDYMIFATDLAGTITIFNIGAERMLGYRAAEVVDELTPLVIHDREEIVDAATAFGVAPGFDVLSALGRRGVGAREWTLVRKDGSRLPVSMSIGLRRSRHGDEIGFIFIARNVSEVRRIEAERARLFEREMEARAQLDATLDAMPVAVALLDPDLRFLRVNREMAALSDRPAEQHVGRGMRDVLPIDLATSMEPYLRRVLATRQPVFSAEIEGSASGDPTRRRHWLGTYFPVSVPDRSVVGLGSVMIDITQRKAMEEALRHSTEFRERLMNIVSHDLRNPLSVLLGSIELSLGQPEVGEALRRLLERADRNARHMARLVHDLLDVAQVNLGNSIPIATRRLDPRDVCARVIDDVRATNPERKVRLDVRCEASANIDPDRFAQIVTNLLVNAIKYGAPDEPVIVTLRDVGPCIELSVLNKGPPIPAERLPRIFDAFERGSAEGGQQGVGLGLFIVREIARAHHGRVEAHSSARDGTSIVVTLPREGPVAGATQVCGEASSVRDE